MTRESQLAELKRMVSAFEENRNRMAAIAHHLRLRAEGMTLKARPKQDYNGRHKATWTGADERCYLACFLELEARLSAEVASLSRKLDRQRKAISERSQELGLNDPPKLDEIPKIHPGIWLPRR